MGALKVFQILFEGGLIELGEELGGDGGIESSDFVYQLTFAHDRFTFETEDAAAVATAFFLADFE